MGPDLILFGTIFAKPISKLEMAGPEFILFRQVFQCQPGLDVCLMLLILDEFPPANDQIFNFVRV